MNKIRDWVILFHLPSGKPAHVTTRAHTKKGAENNFINGKEELRQLRLKIVTAKKSAPYLRKHYKGCADLLKLK